MSDVKKVYFGALKLKTNQRRPSMTEAVNANQVRWFGINKIDSRVLEHSDKNKIDTKNDNALRKKLLIKHVKFNERAKQLKYLIGRENLTEDEKKPHRKELKLIESKHPDVKKQLNEVNVRLGKVKKVDEPE